MNLDELIKVCEDTRWQVDENEDPVKSAIDSYAAEHYQREYDNLGSWASLPESSRTKIAIKRARQNTVRLLMALRENYDAAGNKIPDAELDRYSEPDCDISESDEYCPHCGNYY